MKVAFVTHYDARDVINWSGTGFNMANCLKNAGLEVEYIGPLRKQLNPINIARYFFNEKILKKRDHPQRDLGFLRYYGRQVERKLKDSDADVIVAPGNVALCYVETNLPMVLWTDCTFANLVDYYPAFSNLSARTLRNGHEIERRVLDRCDLLLFSCQWAADSAINDYGADPSKIHLQAFGSNMPGERTPEDIERLIAARVEKLQSKVTLFASGVSWYRKGIDVAVEVTTRLNEMGIKTELLVAGCSPPKGQTIPDYVRLLGFIKKSDPGGNAQLAKLYETSHGFILPTRADCTPIVYNESASYGLPSLGPRSGGCASVIEDGVSGFVFEPTAPAQDWADRFGAVLRDPVAYANLCRSSYADYCQRLNWTASGQSIRKHLETLLASKGAKKAPEATAVC
jgi:glycosyltransferase involved in cell wall biosynthesis